MRSACVGIAANDCQTINDGGGTTVGMGFCYGHEGEWWDARLNDAYSQLMKREQANDAEFAGMASAPVRAPALRECSVNGSPIAIHFVNTKPCNGAEEPEQARPILPAWWSKQPGSISC